MNLKLQGREATLSERRAEGAGAGAAVCVPFFSGAGASPQQFFPGGGLVLECARRAARANREADRLWMEWKANREDGGLLMGYAKCLRRAWVLRQGGLALALGLDVVFETADERVVRLGVMEGGEG